MQFEKMEKYADRHERWLDMRIKTDGHFKKEEFKIIAETIEEFSQQETQGSSESVVQPSVISGPRSKPARNPPPAGPAQVSGRDSSPDTQPQLSLHVRAIQAPA
ncbi:hypothetical protein TIFTF001_026849 [Ficus carica]|uniref:Uncharacterized protein n=1 Tax=Ficus carica TaxID=3494 RepID=A0AA88IYQ8_FICCA|nr:hypothetical protein TIFTF001_026849 [Ficus carica]